MKLFASPKLAQFKKALDVYSRQHEAIAKNVAHAHDNSYKRVNTDFSAELQNLSSQKLRTTDSRHMGPAEKPASPELPGEDRKVDLNSEMGELAVNQIRFDFVSRVLAKAYRGLNASITGRNQ